MVQSMGLRRIRHSVELTDTPESRGMIHKVRHLVVVRADVVIGQQWRSRCESDYGSQ